MTYGQRRDEGWTKDGQRRDKGRTKDGQKTDEGRTKDGQRTDEGRKSSCLILDKSSILSPVSDKMDFTVAAFSSDNPAGGITALHCSAHYCHTMHCITPH